MLRNAILIAELEGKVPQSRWSLSAHNFSNSGYFYEIFDTHFQKGSVYFYIKKISWLLLYFWNYNPSPNEQIVSLIDDQTHLQIRLLREYLQPYKLKKNQI